MEMEFMVYNLVFDMKMTVYTFYCVYTSVYVYIGQRIWFDF